MQMRALQLLTGKKHTFILKHLYPDQVSYLNKKLINKYIYNLTVAASVQQEDTHMFHKAFLFEFLLNMLKYT